MIPHSSLLEKNNQVTFKFLHHSGDSFPQTQFYQCVKTVLTFCRKGIEKHHLYFTHNQYPRYRFLISIIIITEKHQHIQRVNRQLFLKIEELYRGKI